MNLSALNKLPSNSLSVAAAEAPSTDNGLSRLSTHSLSGADFASFLHNQVQALKNPQRQDLAAGHGKLPQAASEVSSHADDKHGAPVRAKSSPRDESVQDSKREAAANSKAKQAEDANARAESADADQSQKEASAQATAADEQAMQDKQTADTDAAASQADTTQLTQAANSLSDSTQANSALTTTEENLAKSTDSQESKDKAATALDLSSQPGALTTIALSDKLQIITTAQTSPSEKSVADFALAMGLDPNQVKALFGPSSAAAASAQMKTGLTTQDMLGLNALPTLSASDTFSLSGQDTPSVALPVLALNTPPVSSADFQALQQVSDSSQSQPELALMAKMDNVQIQVGTAQAQLTAAPPPPSTLSVLSMMDATLRAEDIESLKNEFDAAQAAPAADGLTLSPGTGFSPTGQRNAAHTAAPAAQVFADNPDMAQTYENLSQKLTTELAARMHEKLNAGEWKMKFALKPASLGLVDVQLEMRDGKLTAQFQSDTALTQDLIQNGSQRLKDALSDMGMGNASVLVGQGQSQSTGQSGQGGTQGQTGLPAKRGENRAKLTEEPGPKIAKDSVPGRNKRSQFDSYA